MISELIEFKSHNPKWARVFEQQVAGLDANLGEFIVAAHHVGSTAIPSIKAKPIIDIAIESLVYPPNDSIVEALAEIEFLAHGNAGVEGRNWFSKGIPRTINLHWCPVNGAVVQSQVRFRDALRANVALAREYQALKKTAANGRTIDSTEYAAAKSMFIEMVLSR